MIKTGVVNVKDTAVTWANKETFLLANKNLRICVADILVNVRIA